MNGDLTVIEEGTNFISYKAHMNLAQFVDPGSGQDGQADIAYATLPIPSDGFTHFGVYVDGDLDTAEIVFQWSLDKEFWVGKPSGAGGKGDPGDISTPTPVLQNDTQIQGTRWIRFATTTEGLDPDLSLYVHLARTHLVV